MEKNIVLQKIIETLGKYYDALRDDHPYTMKESRREAEKYHTELLLRYQDYESIIYDPEDDRDLNFNDYE